MKKDEGTYIELFGKRASGPIATLMLVALWLLPFVAGYVLGAHH